MKKYYFPPTKNYKPIYKHLWFVLLVLSSAITFAQSNPGNPANFSVFGDVYSGIPDAGTDDWFQGPTGFGLIDETQTSTWLGITQGLQNTPFTVGSTFNQYEIKDGRILYEAIYIRDYVNLNSAGGTLDETTFEGGNKNGDNPETVWGIITSTVGQKNDIVDSYAHIRRDGSTIDTDMWIDLAVSCIDSSGDHFIDFEFFKSQIAVSGGGFVNSGPDDGHTAWQFDANGNVLSTGDLVIGFDYNSTSINEIVARIWVKRTDFSNINPAFFDWGADFDGDWNGFGYAEVAIPTGLIRFDDLSANSVPGPPWGTFGSNSSNPYTANYENGALAELAVNLTNIGLDPGLYGGNPCDAPFTRLIVKSRTSTSFTSQLKDFSGPYDFLAPPVFDTTIKDAGPFYCETELTLEPLNPSGAAYYTWTTTDGEFADGSTESTELNPKIVKPGTYTLSAAPFPGCTATSSDITILAGPCAIDDHAGTVTENQGSITYNVINNTDNTSDFDLSNDIDLSSINNAGLLQPSNGTVSFNTSTGEITYTPNPGYFGVDTFEYQICDATGLCDVALVTVYVLQDSEDDEVDNITDLDDDNDGILDINELNCSSGPVAVDASNTLPRNTAFNSSNTASGSVGPVFSSLGVTASFDYNLVGNTTWNSGVRIQNYAGSSIDGDVINTQVINTNLYDGDYAEYTLRFSEPVYNLSFVWSGLDNNDKVTFDPSNSGSSVGVIIENISIPSADLFLSGNAVESSASPGNAPQNAVSVTIAGPVDTIVIRQGKNSNNRETFNSTAQLYNVAYCLALDTDNDGTPDHLDLDSDGDGCSDADEAYASLDADAGDTGVYGTDFPLLSNGGVNANGLVNVAGVSSDGTTYTTLPATTFEGQNSFQAGVTISIDSEVTAQSTCVDESVTFSAVASMSILPTTPATTVSDQLTYQWLVSSDSGANFTEIAGASGTVASGETIEYTIPSTPLNLNNNIYQIYISHPANICGAFSEEGLTVWDAPTIDSSIPTNVSCNGDSTGAIDITVSGGTAPYTFAWTNGSTSEDLTNITAGTYNVIVTDTNGCTATLNSPIVITEPEPISIILTKENATTAQGCANGEATATPAGGTAPYTYLWSASAGGQTTATATNLPSGTHTVTVTDANGCELEQGVVIDCTNTCDAIIAIEPIGDVLCTGDNTGSTTVSASSAANPNATFTFTWNTTPATVDTGVTSSSLTNLTAGIYTVSVTIDGTVCLPVEQSVTIVEPANAINVSATSTDENGPTTGDGTATAVVSGGTPPYTYSWSPSGETTESISGLSAGDYTVTTTDANGCSDTATVTVNPGSCLNLTVFAATTPVTCNGDSDGTATATVSGGSGSFSYSWDAGGQTTATINGLAGGSYTVTVTDLVTLCTQTATATVNEPNALDSGIAITNVLCFGENTGSLDLTVTGGTAPYSFAWDNGGTTEDINNLTAGNYNVTITDANGCITTNSATIVQPDNALNITSNVTNVLCNGDATGAIDITVSGGTAPYNYSWSNGATTEDLTNIIAGSYSVTITDANGCTINSNETISEPSAELSIVLTKENATTAQGCANGEATATPAGGTAPYTYLWSASAGGQTTATATNLPSGTHTVTVTDANGCELEQGVVIDCTNTCDAIIAIEPIGDVLCTGDNTGSTTVSASSAANPNATFTFTWNTTPATVDTGVTSSSLTNLTAGIYTVSVTIDGTVCLPVEQSVTIVEPANAINVSATSTDENGPTTGDGTATAVVSGGTPPYTYSWSPSGETTESISGLSAGDYTVTTTDANGCSDTATVTVNPGSCLNLTVFAATTPVTCNGDSDGTATATVSGGSGSFSYSWDAGGQTTATINGLAGGSYTVTVTDLVTLCTQTATATVNEPNALDSGIAITNVLCFGENTGSLDLTVTGGTAPYSFAWDNGESTEDINNLTAGNYNVTITDANGCITTNSATIVQPDNALNITSNVTNVLCNGDATGAIDITVSGGTAPYNYSWSNGATTEDLTNIIAGSYSVTITDANGCTINSNETISEPSAELSIVLTKENATTAQGCANGEATATPAGGTAPYTYLWSASAGGQTTATATNLPSGTHTVTVTDANGCELEQGVVIDCTNTCDAIIAIEPIGDVLCTGDNTGSTTVSASSAANPNATFTFTWNTTPATVDTGVTSSSLTNLTAGIYTVSVTIDGTVCLPVEQSVTIVEPANAINVSATSTDENGPTTGDGTATAVVSGGTPPYTYSWSPSGETTESISGLSAGDYTVTTTDANGCSDTATVTVNPGSCLNLTVFAATTPVTCNGDSDGTATATVSGGSGSFSYSWDAGGQTTATINGLAGGSYTVTVTDLVTLCTQTATATVNEPNALDSGIAITNVLCFGENTGSLDLTVTGGTAPYSFAWDNGGTTEDINNLTAGNYNVTITDANGCITTNSATIVQPDNALNITSNVTNVLCNGDATGAIDITVSGGTAPYNYSWSNGATTEDLTNIIAGSYSVTITDANGCTINSNETISEPSAELSIVLTKENATTAQGCANGEATATPAGGTAPYTYLWSASAGGQTTATATNLPSGTHTVTVTDANGCELEQGVVIDCTNTCDAIIAIEPIGDVLCTGDNTGSTTVSASSAANPNATFTFTWNTTPATVDTGVTSSSLTNLTAGIYTVSVTIDGTVCLPVEQSVTIVEPANAINVSATSTDENGPTTGDGTATAVVSGGTPPYTYSWSPSGETTESISGLSAGDYTVTTTDANGCSDTATVTVNPGSCLNLTVFAATTPVTCNGDSDGTATATVSGGSGSFSYSWDAGGQTTATINGLAGGSYTVTVTDLVTLCTQTATATVNEPNALDSGIAITNVLCFGENTGSLDLTVTGGTAPYSFCLG